MKTFSFLCLWAVVVIQASAAGLTPPNRSLYLDGDARLVFPHRPEYDSQVSMTVEAWIFVKKTNSFQTILSHNFAESFYFGLESNQELRFYRSGGFPNFEDSNQAVPIQRWTHVAVSYDGTRARFYIDGQPAGDDLLSHAGADRAQELWVGHDPNGDLGFNGHIDELRLWSVVRTPDQIRDHRFEEITADAGLVARISGRDYKESVADVGGIPTGAVLRQWGVLPRDYVVPRSLVPVNYDQSLGEFSANRAERIIWRYRTWWGGERDVEGMMMYRDEADDRNLYVAIPPTPDRAEDLNDFQKLWFSFMVDTNAAGNEFPDTSVLRFDSTADNLTPEVYTNRLRQGSASGYVNLDTPSPGSNSWDIVTAESCEFECGRIFRVPEDMLGGFAGYKLGLFGEFAYAHPIGLSEWQRPSTFDSNANAPFTWPLLIFSDPAVSLATAEVYGRVYDATPEPVGADFSDLRVFLRNADDGTVFGSGLTDSAGRFSFAATVYPRGVRLQVTSSKPSGLWRALPPVVVTNSLGVELTGEFEGVIYEPCTSGSVCDLGHTSFRLVQHRSPSITGYDPPVGTPRLVLRNSPRETTDPTRFELQGANFHPYTRFYLSHRRCDWPLGFADPLPEGFGCTNFPLRVVNRTLDWSSVELELDFELDARLNVPGESWVRGPYRILCQDGWTGTWEASTAGFVIAEEYPKVHGFEFDNERDGTQFDEFSNVFKWNAYDCVTPIGPFLGANPCIGCRVPNPVYLAFHSLVFTPWAELMTGSCLGMASTSLKFARNEFVAENFDTMARYAAGLQGVDVLKEDGSLDYIAPPKPQDHNFRVCDYSEPRNLWAHIHRNQVSQISSEFFHMMLDQMSGTGLAPAYAYSVDGDPNTVLGRLRVDLSHYVLGFHYSGDIIKAHSVTPYALVDGFGYDTNSHTMVVRTNSTAIMVYDSNHPLRTDKFIEVDRSANTYRYFWGFVEKVEDGVTNNVPEYWDGTGVYTYPITFFDQALHMPGADLLVRTIALLLFGGADASYVDSEDRRWGWDEDGTFVDEYLGAKAIAPFSNRPDDDASPESNTSRAIYFFPPTNSPPDHIVANVRGKQYKFFAGETGVAAFLEVGNTVPGESDRLWVSTEDENGPLKSFGFAPGVFREHFTPRIGILSSNIPSVLYEWVGLNASPERPVEFIGIRDIAGAEYRNHGKDATSHILRIHRNGPNGMATNEFGPFEIPGGGAHRTSFTGWPETTLRSELDLDQDGIPEQIGFVTPPTGQNPELPVLTATLVPEGMMISWPVSSVAWQLIHTPDLGVPHAEWKDVDAEPFAVGEFVNVLVPMSESKGFFKLRRLD